MCQHGTGEVGTLSWPSSQGTEVMATDLLEDIQGTGQGWALEMCPLGSTAKMAPTCMLVSAVGIHPVAR